MAYKIKAKPKYELVTRKFKVYSIENLPEDARKKAFEEHRYFNVDFGDWWHDDFMLDQNLTKSEYEKVAKKFGRGNTLFEWNSEKMAFSLDRSNYIQFTDLKVNDPEIFRQVCGISKKTWGKVSYSFVNERENDTELNFYEEEDLTEKEKAELEKAKEKFALMVEKAKKDLHENYDYQTSDKAIEEGFEANDYKFTEDGKIFS